MKIYVKFKPPPTLKEFLLKFFSINTHNDGVKGVETFLDKECKVQQCPSERNRSIQDTFECVKTYFPETTLTELVTELMKLRPFDKYFWPFFCNGIQRPVIWFNIYPLNSLPPKIGDSEYSWNSLIRKCGIKTAEEMYT